MLNRFARAFFTKLLTPLARLFLRLGIRPDVVTMVGTLGVCVGALVFYPRNQFFWGTIIISVFALSDTLDGIMARLSGWLTQANPRPLNVMLVQLRPTLRTTSGSAVDISTS